MEIIYNSFFSYKFNIGAFILFLFLNLELSNKYSLFYSALISILFYPVVGTPFVDHHSTFFFNIGFLFFDFSN